ncbi:MAG: PIN domain-containing protein [Bacteroidota bacterium]
MMYLLDTNACIHFMAGKYGVGFKALNVGLDNCFISEITVLELMYGAACSRDKINNRNKIDSFVSMINVKLIDSAFDIFSTEKIRLKQAGLLIADFDLLIGATAIANSYTLVTNNTKHFIRLHNIQLEVWTIK